MELVQSFRTIYFSKICSKVTAQVPQFPPSNRNGKADKRSQLRKLEVCFKVLSPAPPPPPSQLPYEIRVKGACVKF